MASLPETDIAKHFMGSDIKSVTMKSTEVQILPMLASGAQLLAIGAI